MNLDTVTERVTKLLKRPSKELTPQVETPTASQSLDTFVNRLHSSNEHPVREASSRLSDWLPHLKLSYESSQREGQTDIIEFLKRQKGQNMWGFSVPLHNWSNLWEGKLEAGHTASGIATSAVAELLGEQWKSGRTVKDRFTAQPLPSYVERQHTTFFETDR